MRLAAAGACEIRAPIAVEAVFGSFQRMLPGEQQDWLDAASAKGVGDGRELDGFGAGTDCKRNWSGQ